MPTTTSYPYDSSLPYDSSNPYDSPFPKPTTGARQIADGISAEYRYYLVDLLSDEVIAEIPFSNVSFERSLSKAGVFAGDIPYIDATTGLDLYESTMPGKSCIFVLRDGVCVWGGVIWAREYSPISKVLKVDASEFISLFYHRVVWQTLFYGTPSVDCTKYQAISGVATVFTSVPHTFLAGETVRILNLNSALNGYQVIDSVTPASFTFSTTAELALSPSNTGIARVVLNSYETTRQIIANLLQDFSGLGFANDFIRPATEDEYSLVYKASSPIIASSPAKSTYTLTTSIPHELVVGQEVEIISVDSNVNGFRVVSSVPSSTTFEVIVDGTITIGSTAILGLTTYDISSRSIEETTIVPTYKAVSNNLATLTFATPHLLVPDDYISVSEIDNSVSFTYSSVGVIGDFVLTLPDVTNLEPGMLVSGSVLIPVGTVIRSITGLTVTISNAPTGSFTTVISYTRTLTLNGSYQVHSTPDAYNLTYVTDNRGTVSTLLTSGKVLHRSAVLSTNVPHGINAGDNIVVSDIGIDYDGDHVVSSAPDYYTIKYNVFSTENQAGEAVWGGTAKAGSRASYRTYGAYSGNSDFHMQVDSSETTKVIGYDQQIFRGSDLKTFGEILDEFTKDINGFEYRVDCDFQNGTFNKTFTFVPFFDPTTKVLVSNKQLVSNVATLTTTTDHNLVVGQDIVVSHVGASFDGTFSVVSTPTTTTFTYNNYGYNNVPSTGVSGYIGLVHPISYLGADQVIFEYPGNVIDFSFTENAEASATRMWVAGNSNGLDNTASQPYAGATDATLLEAGWPILDQVENKSDNISAALGEEALYGYARDYLDESRPPEGTFTLTVNGSLDPKVGDYLPGQWCSIIINDPFVKSRLANDLEPRSDVIVRKIASIKVSVPNSVAFPEKVTLDLIPEWREDRRLAQ